MISFTVPDMSCGHCVATITRAVHDIDGDAVVHIDLEAHRVRIEPRRADAASLQRAIAGAGFTPVNLDRSAV